MPENKNNNIPRSRTLKNNTPKINNNYNILSNFQIANIRNNESELNELKNKLNDERKINQILLKENNDLKKRIKEDLNKNQKLIKENKDLKQRIKEEINKYQILTKENNDLKIRIDILDNEIKKMKNQILTLENNLTKKNTELQTNISQINKDKYSITSINPGERVIAVNFLSMGSHDIGNYNLVCKNTELFVRLEERLYEDFPQFKEYETYFEVKTKRIKRFKTLKENNIKTNDVINVFIIDN